MTDSFGNRLKKLRKKAGISQPELAELVGVHETTIRRWENSHYTPDARVVSLLADALHVSVSDLFNDPAPDTQGEWVINIKTAQNFTEEVVDLSGNVMPIVSITQTPQGVSLTIQSNWRKLDSVNGLRKLFKEIEKVYPAIRQGGVALGGLEA